MPDSKIKEIADAAEIIIAGFGNCSQLSTMSFYRMHHRMQKGEHCVFSFLFVGI